MFIAGFTLVAGSLVVATKIAKRKSIEALTENQKLKREFNFNLYILNQREGRLDMFADIPTALLDRYDFVKQNPIEVIYAHKRPKEMRPMHRIITRYCREKYFAEFYAKYDAAERGADCIYDAEYLYREKNKWALTGILAKLKGG